MIRFNGYPFLEKEDKEDDDHAYVESSGFLLLAAASNGIISDDLFDNSRPRHEEGSHCYAI